MPVPHVERSPLYLASVGILLLVTFVWGTTFIATSKLVAGDRPLLSPGAVTFWRFAVAALAFVPFAPPWRLPRAILWPAVELSLWLAAGYATQVIGLQTTSVPRSAFITSLNVVFVPVLTLLAGRRVGWVVWAAVGLALVGAAVMTNEAGAPPNVGDLWTLGCAVTWACYIFRLERFAPRFDALHLTAAQLWGVGILCLPWMAGEATVGGSGWGTWTTPVVLAVLYLGVVATLLTTWLQAIGQRHVPGTHTSLLYTTEPVFASAVAMVFGVWLSPQGWAGGALILIAAAGSQVIPMLLTRRQK